MPAEGAAAGPIRVMLVDDHRVVRSGVTAYLEQVGDIEVVGEARDGRQALDRIALLELGEDLPDVVLMDLLMPEMDGITATRQIKSHWPTIEVVALTSFVEEAKVRGALEAGAAGYLLKDADADEVAQAVRAAYAGQMHLDPTVARLLADSLRGPQQPGDDLTPREREVLALVAEGASNRQIAENLVVSERTARTHVSAILSKLGLASVPRPPCGRLEKVLRPAPDALPKREDPSRLAELVHDKCRGAGPVIWPMSSIKARTTIRRCPVLDFREVGPSPATTPRWALRAWSRTNPNSRSGCLSSTTTPGCDRPLRSRSRSSQTWSSLPRQPTPRPRWPWPTAPTHRWRSWTCSSPRT